MNKKEYENAEKLNAIIYQICDDRVMVQVEKYNLHGAIFEEGLKADVGNYQVGQCVDVKMIQSNRRKNNTLVHKFTQV